MRRLKRTLPRRRVRVPPTDWLPHTGLFFVDGPRHDTEPTVWTVPEPRSTLDVRLDDGSLTRVRRHGNPSGPCLVLSHGTGLAIDLYVPFWSAFLADFDVFVHDVRNHGWNAVGTLANHTIPTFASDHDRIVAAIDGLCGRKPKIGVYHSLAATAALVALAGNDSAADPRKAAPRPGSLDALILFDPPLYMRAVADDVFFALAEIAAAKTRRKRSRFATLEEFEARVARASKFSRVVPGVHNLMARTTLRQRTDGPGYALRCPPEYEARVFADTRRWTGRVRFAQLGCPIKVIGSDPTQPTAYVPSLEDEELALVEYETIADTTHFLQLEAPTACARAVLAHLERRGLSGASASPGPERNTIHTG